MYLLIDYKHSLSTDMSNREAESRAVDTQQMKDLEFAIKMFRYEDQQRRDEEAIKSEAECSIVFEIKREDGKDVIYID